VIKPLTIAIAIGIGLPLAIGTLWIQKNAEDFFSWSPADWEHDDRDQNSQVKNEVK
jgi:hypothetical protein